MYGVSDHAVPHVWVASTAVTTDARAIVTAQAKSGAQGSAASAIDISVTGAQSGDTRQKLPGGALAYLTFKATDDAPLGTRVAIDIQAITVQNSDEPAREMQPVIASGGEISITGVIPRCFFYMH